MGAMTILITGAAGFIGARTVAAARARGHYVRALVRGAARREWADDDGVLVHRADMGSPEPAQPQSQSVAQSLAEALVGVDAVIHLAARLRGDAHDHARDTDAATRMLLAGMGTGMRLVLVSSISVYDYKSLKPGATLRADTPLDGSGAGRDDYARAKLAQETAARGWGGDDLRVVRPGIVYGPGRLWNASLGVAAGPLLAGFAPDAPLPLTFVDNCAAALVAAAEAAHWQGPINIIDPAPPLRSRYLAAAGLARPGLPLPWQLLETAGCIAGALPGIAARRPGLLRPAALRARALPLGYDTAPMQTLMQDRTLVPFDTAIAESQSSP